MIDIVPNWHPMVVHFALALPLSASALYTVAWLLPERPMATGAVGAAHWMLGIGITALWLAIGTGMYAWFTVTHDAEGLRAMSIHQYWGWATAVLYTCALPLWSAGAPRRVPTVFVVLLLVAACSAVVTGYLGAENVYRHGIGVERLPLPAY